MRYSASEMANTSSAKKAKRVALRRRVFNVRRKRAVHDSLKALEKDVSLATFAAYQQALDKAAKHGTITKNAAARIKSRAAKRFLAKKK